MSLHLDGHPGPEVKPGQAGGDHGCHDTAGGLPGGASDRDNDGGMTGRPGPGPTSRTTDLRRDTLHLGRFHGQGEDGTVGERIDYLDDPAAPKATSIVPSASVIVVNDQGEILMIRRTDNGNWAVPGGGMDPGESIIDTAIRETREESGIQCEITGLVGVYTNPRHVIRYTSNNEVRQEFSIVFTARPLGGQLRPSSESSMPQWVSPAAIPSLQMHPSMRQRIQHYLDKRSSPYLG